MLRILVVLNTVTELGGRMHPVVVHLPIGILMLVGLYYLLVPAEKRQSQYSFINVALFFGMLTAIAACISGLLLSRSGDYDDATVAPHQWMGIITALVAVACYVMHKQQVKFAKWGMIILVACITIAGHLGGSITHGADYLTAPLQSSAVTARKPIANVQEAIVYTDIIEPILSAKCYSCHGSGKQKGKLRLDEPSFILKGGKGGAALSWGDAGKSRLIERILLPGSDEEHMPPKEKPQLTRGEIDLLHWWINSGAGFDKKVSQSVVADKVKATLAALQSGAQQAEVGQVMIPEQEVAEADEKVVQALRSKGAVVIPVAAGTNYLSVNFVGADKVTAQELHLLESLKEQLVWLKVGHARITDPDMVIIGKLTNLRKLYLEGNPVTDAGIAHLKSLKQLQYINLSGTRISPAGPSQLAGLTMLKNLYLYNISGARFDLTTLRKVLPGAKIDTGGYIVPILESDTTVLKGLAEM
jgi:uncharacterized membrane protein/mono/diheme cytochrome c family protein